MFLLAILDKPVPWTIWLAAGAGFLLLLLLLFVGFSLAARRFIHRDAKTKGSSGIAPRPNAENPAAFMTASMQAVIQKLREQEKELERLHQREKQRAQQTERLSEAVTRNMPAGLLLVNSTGLISSANPAAETALGIRSLPFRRYSEVFGPESTLAKMIQGCLEQGETFRREEVEYTTPNRELRQLGVTISPITNKPGEISGALCLLSDLTELAGLQRQIQMKENLAALGELSAGIAHEFKNALATISGYAQMIRGEANGDEVAENANRILEQTRAITHVVTEFLKFARPLNLADEDVLLEALIRRLADDVHEAHPGVNISVEGDFAELSGDEALLRQALLNLVKNAAEAAAEQQFGGRITVHGSLETGAGGSTQRISITDNGRGIPADSLPKVFVPFYTTKPQGTGLGLAIVQKIIVQHGGTVEARNLSEGGAEFIVWLPTRRLVPQDIVSTAARN
ncbi:MAG TPA: ATP-binding protein [Candidatus Acidoferrales bacterium]|jgi:PAS domain S-box-containing protein|nr:ATP-binding protein [Candidatus Acidoferrales bacterium]